MSSGLDGLLGLLEDRERRRRRPCVLWGSLGLWLFLWEAAVAQLRVWASTALNIRGVRGLLHPGGALQAWLSQRLSLVLLASSLRPAASSGHSPRW